MTKHQRPAAPSAPGWYAAHTGYTLLETALGFGLAVVLGVAMSIAIVYSRFVEQTLYTLLVAMNSIPKVAVAPLFIVWLGTGLEPKVAIAFLIAVFPIVIDTVLGLRTVDPEMLDLARAMRGTRYQTLRKIRFPGALPSLFAGMKVGISFAFIGSIVGEFVAAQRGLGFVIVSAAPLSWGPGIEWSAAPGFAADISGEVWRGAGSSRYRGSPGCAPLYARRCRAVR